MPTLNVKLTEDLNRFVADKVESGRYSDASEVVTEALRCLEREDKSDAEKLAALRAAIEAGFASGVAEGDPVARVRAKRNLPPRARRV